MKTYIQTIQILQKLLISLSIFILLTIPILISFLPELFSNGNYDYLYLASHISLFLVMLVRPLADIVDRLKQDGSRNLIRPLVILRKGLGIFSASIIVSFMLSKIIINPYEFFSSFLTYKYWSLINYALLAHLADISAIALLVTSNNLSKKILGGWWKKIQKLAYVYFYASSLYVFLSYGDIKMAYFISTITTTTFLAFIINSKK